MPRDRCARGNREIGVKPMRSRRRNAEDASRMSLGDREDEANDDAEPEDLPNLVRRERQLHCADAPL